MAEEQWAQRGPRAKKVVLAYSGGVDTSVCIPYLRQEWGV